VSSTLEMLGRIPSGPTASPSVPRPWSAAPPTAVSMPNVTRTAT